MTWRHRCPWNPSNRSMMLESVDESSVHERKDDEAYVEHLVEKCASSSTSEKLCWLSQTKSTCLSAFLWTKTPFDHSCNRPEDLAFLASISKVAENVGN
jgi:hypothetical protein